MGALFVEYPKCSTCRKAKAWLDANGIDYIDRHIVEDNPTAEELAAWQAQSGLAVRRFFNTSGKLYRELNVKARLDASMSDDEAFALLASEGMLVKRPLLVTDDAVCVGFRQLEWAAALGVAEPTPATPAPAAPASAPTAPAAPTASASKATSAPAPTAAPAASAAASSERKA